MLLGSTGEHAGSGGSKEEGCASACGVVATWKQRAGAVNCAIVHVWRAKIVQSDYHAAH